MPGSGSHPVSHLPDAQSGLGPAPVPVPTLRLLLVGRSFPDPDNTEQAIRDLIARHDLAKRLMRTDVIVGRAEGVEPSLLSGAGRGRGPGRVAFEDAVHVFVAPVLFRMAAADAVQPNVESQPPDRQVRQPGQRGARKGDAVIAANCVRQSELLKDVTKPLECADLARRQHAVAVQHRRTEESYVHDEAITQQIEDLTDGVGVDVALEMSGANAALNTAISAVRRGGHVILFGLKSGDAVIEHLDKVIVEGITLHAVIGRRIFETWHITKNLLESREPNIHDLIWDVILNRGQGTVVDFGLQIPDVSFPFDVGSGVQKYQRRKLHFGFLEVSVDAELIRRFLQYRTLLGFYTVKKALVFLPATPHCDSGSHTCVNCTDSSQCTSDPTKAICFNHVCQGCASNFGKTPAPSCPTRRREG